MAFDQVLADRLEDIIAIHFEDMRLIPKRMFGGICYTLNGSMCFGIFNDMLIVRVGVEAANVLLKESHVRQMNLTGKSMKGWLTIEPEAIYEDEELLRFCETAVEFVKTLPKKILSS
ncbi:MAG: TfoX/Sxy family protein [Alphaproteobacteria bacterium]|nr:MAG: TfoX/Sxy family protein [Alphaproteobacteria bacterium]